MMSAASCTSAGVNSLTVEALVEGLVEGFMARSCPLKHSRSSRPLSGSRRIYADRDMACKLPVGYTRGTAGGGMLQLQSAFGILALLAIAFALSERHSAVSWKQAAVGLAGDVCHRRRAVEGSLCRKSLRRHQRCGRRDRQRHARGHLVRVRLCRRRPPALRGEDARRGFRARLPGAAADPGHERADDAVVLLAHPAADRARLLLRAGADAEGRRRGRAVGRGQHLSRHGGSAAVHQAVSGKTHPQRIVPGDDRRHGRHRRHRAGALFGDPGASHSRCVGAFRHRLRARRAGGDRHRADHGARNDATRKPKATS